MTQLRRNMLARFALIRVLPVALTLAATGGCADDAASGAAGDAGGDATGDAGGDAAGDAESDATCDGGCEDAPVSKPCAECEALGVDCVLKDAGPEAGRWTFSTYTATSCSGIREFGHEELTLHCDTKQLCLGGCEPFAVSGNSIDTVSLHCKFFNQ